MGPSSRGASSHRKGGVPRSLTEHQIVGAALDLTREVGLESLTMNALAERLGVGVMTLYSYFRGRGELLDAMAKRASIDLYDQHNDASDAPWDVELRTHYHAIRDSLKRHPALADLLFYRGQVLGAGPDRFDPITDHIQGHVRSMVDAGIDPALAVRAFIGISFFTLTSALREEDFKEATPFRSRVEELLASISNTTPPDQVADVRFGSDEQFETLLDLLLRGLKSTVNERGHVSKPQPRGRR